MAAAPEAPEMRAKSNMHTDASPAAEPNLMVDMFRLVRRNRRWILVTSAVVLALGVTLCILLTRIYRAEVLVAYSAPDETSQPLALLANGLGSLAPLAGLGNSPAGDSRAEAIATLKSRTLSLQFIEQHGLMPHLFPGDWDAKTGRWQGDAADAPTQAEAFKRFDEDIRGVEEDATTGLIRVSIDGPERDQVAAWANALVNDANAYLRERALQEARSAISALEGALQKTDTLEIKQIIFGLIQTHLSKATLASTRPDFAFRVIDAAVVPDADDYVRPMPILIIALSCLLGPILGFLLALLRDAWTESR
jgi:uncharacterized protein involved in exopolysaccharide biosynthesis